MINRVTEEPPSLASLHGLVKRGRLNGPGDKLALEWRWLALEVRPPKLVGSFNLAMPKAAVVKVAGELPPRPRFDDSFSRKMFV